MSDFPSSECPPIPWRDAVQRVPLGNTMAPGPPSARPSTGKKKASRAMAANLRGLVPPDDDQIKSNGVNECVDGWDPMSEDYHCPDFNAYSSGTGALMQAAQNSGGGGDGTSQQGSNINLFITGIPTALAKNSLRDLFSRAGVVKKAYIVKQHSRAKQTTYGFIEFATIKEADSAIQMFHDFDMGGGIKLSVKVSENKESRQKRQSEKIENDAFLSTLNCSKYATSQEDTSVANGYELTAEEIKLCEQTPFQPAYSSREPVCDSPQEPCVSLDTVEEGGGEVAEGVSLSGSAGASSLQAASLASPTQPSPADSITPGPCRSCGTVCKRKCKECKTLYCGERCQRSDWDRHRFECKKTSGGVVGQPQPHQRDPSSIVIQEREDSDGEGFDIPTPPLEELMKVLQKPQDTVNRAAKRISSENSVSGPPPSDLDHDQTAEDTQLSSSRPLSLPIVGPSVMKQMSREEVTPPHSPSQSPVFSVRDDASAVTPPPAGGSAYGRSLSHSEILEVFQSAKFPLPSIPLGCEPPKIFRAVVTSGLSCVRFSVILMSVESKQALKTIMECGTTFHLPPVEPYCLVVGSKVGYIDQHGSLFRMEVKQLIASTDTVELRYYDVGGSFKTSFSQSGLVTLPENIVTIPCLRYRCRLNGLWAKDYVGVDYLMTTVKGTPMKITNLGRYLTHTNCAYYKCDLHFLDGQSIVPQVRDFLSRQPSHLWKPTATQPRPSLLSPTTPPSLGPPPPSLHSIAPNGPQPVTPQKGSQYRLMHMAKDVHVHSVTEETFVIVPRVVDSPSSIWAHVNHSKLSYLHRMQEDMNRDYGSGRGEPYSPSVGEMCVVRNCQDGLFYRAEVLCVNNNGTVDVRFVDYGRRELVLVSQVKHIESAYLTLPVQALHFMLVGVAPTGHTLNWGDNAITYLKDKILNREITATVIQTLSQLHHVSLSDPDDPQRSVADDMVSKGLCEMVSNKMTDTILGKMPGVKTLQASLTWDEGTPSHPPPLSPGHHHTPPHQSPSHAKCLPNKKTALPGRGGGQRPKPQSPMLSPETPPTSSYGVGDRSRPNSATGKRSQERSELRGPESPSRSHRELVVPHISLPNDTKVSAMVTVAMSPVQFHVQRFDRAAVMALVDMTEKVNQMKLQPLTHPRVNVYCLARYAEDGCLYRSRVYKCSNSSCTVKFIDYGNMEDVPNFDLYTLPKEFMSLPAQGILCTLKNFRQVVDQDLEERSPPPSSQSIEYFKSLVENKQVTLKVRMVVDSNPMLYPKHVVEVTSEEGEDVLGLMVEGGHSLSAEAKGSPKKQKSGSGGRGKEGGSRRGGGSGGRGGSGEGGRRGGRGGKGEGGFRKGEIFGGFSRGKEEGGFNLREEKKNVPERPWGSQKAEVDKSSPSTPTAGLSVSSPETLVQSPNEHSSGSPERPLTPPSLPSSGGVPLLSSLHVTKLPSDREYVEVVVTEISDPNTIYLQLATEHSLQLVSNLLTDLNSINLQPSSSSSPPVPGQVCCCKFPEDDMWYRATIIRKLVDKCVVLFIDYGNSDTVPFSNILPCPAQFLKVPVMAVQCSLSGVFPLSPAHHWSPAATTFLKEKCCDRVLLAKMESQLADVPLLQLFDTSGDTDVSMSAELIGAGLAVSTPPPAPPTTSGPAPPPRTEPHSVSVTHLPEPVLPQTKEFDVLVMSVNSFTDVNIHPITDDTPQIMSTFMNSITEYCLALATPPTTPPPVGHYCLALFTDGSWFRAKVKSVNSPHGAVDVLFVDFGNSETVSLSQICQMPAQFADVPIQCLQCSMCGIEPEVALEPDPAACTLFGEIATSCKMKCRVLCYSPLVVDLIATSTGRSVREELTAAGKLTPLPANVVFSIPSSSLRPATECKVLVTEVENPRAFWVQCLDSVDVPKLPPLMHAMGVHCNGRQSPPHSPVLGELCCARFSEDDVWYRARIVAFSSPTQCQIRFLDYGNCEDCPVSEVLPLAEKFLSLPALAVLCALSGWEASEEREGERAVIFKSLVENKLVHAVQKGRRGGTTVVEVMTADGPVQKLL